MAREGKRGMQPSGSISDAEKEDRLWKKLKAKAEDVDAMVATPLWHPAQVQHAESSLRSTLTSQDNTPPYPLLAPPSTHSVSRISIQSLMNPTSPMEEQPEARPALFTPINSPTKRCTPTEEAPVWTPLETPTGRGRPRKLPTNAELFVHHGGNLPQADFQIDHNEFHTPQFERHGKLHFADAESLNIDKEDGRVYHMGHVVCMPV